MIFPNEFIPRDKNRYRAMMPIFFLVLIISPNFVQPLPILLLLTRLDTMHKFGADLFSKISDLKNFVDFLSQKEEISLDDIMKEVKSVSNKIDQVADRIEQKIEEAVEKIIKQIPLAQQVNSVTQDLVKYISRVDDLYEDFIEYSFGKKNYNRIILEKFVDVLTSRNADDLHGVLKKIETQVIPGRTASLADGYLILLSKQLALTKLELCDTGISPQRKLFELYSTIVLTEIRGYSMTIFAYAFMENLHNTTFAASMKNAKEKFANRTTRYFNTFVQAAKGAPRDIRTCDPPSQIRGKTFSEFAGLMQTFIAPESDLTEHNNCQGSCANLATKPNNPTTEYRNDHSQWKRQKKCDGSVIKCGYGGGDVLVCESPKNSTRRFEWFRDDGGTMYGKKTDCKEGKQTYTFGWTRGLTRCDYCLCVCVATHPNSLAIRTINLRAQITNTQKNMVVVGVRLFEKYKMIHIQIKEGELQPLGEIKPNSTRWIPLGTFWADDTKDYMTVKYSDFYGIPGGDEELAKAKKTGSIGNLRKVKLQVGTDFAFLKTWQRSLHLDDIYVRPNHVITGARFQFFKKPKNHDDSQPFVLQVRETLFDFEEGKLKPTANDKWISAATMRAEDKPPQYKRERTEFKWNKKPGIPTESVLNLPDSQPNQFITFRNSDFLKDAGQSTIPFIDSVPLVSSPFVALGGIGIFHKGYEGFGGYISPRIMNLDISFYMKAQ